MDDDLKARLLKPRLNEEDVHVEGVGTIRIRPLTRAEVLRLQPLKLAPREQTMIAWAMVDPAMSVRDVEEWARSAPSGELEKVSIAIARLSGLMVKVEGNGKTVEKEAYETFEDDDEAEFRALPSNRIKDDGGRAARADD